MHDVTIPTPLAFSFYGDELLIIEREGEAFIPMKPIVTALGLDWKSQHKKLTSDPRWRYGAIAIPSGGGVQETGCIPLRKISAWLMSISPSRVREDLRDKLALYQEECDEALYRYWTGRAARRSGSQEAEVERLRAQLAESQEMLLAFMPRWPAIRLHARRAKWYQTIARLLRTRPSIIEEEIGAMVACGVLTPEEAQGCGLPQLRLGYRSLEASGSAQAGFEFGEAR